MKVDLQGNYKTASRWKNRQNAVDVHFSGTVKALELYRIGISNDSFQAMGLLIGLLLLIPAWPWPSPMPVSDTDLGVSTLGL